MEHQAAFSFSPKFNLQFIYPQKQGIQTFVNGCSTFIYVIEALLEVTS